MIVIQDGLLEEALARQRRAEQSAAEAKAQLEEERSAAMAARERSKNAAAEGLAEREEKAALRAQLAGAQAQLLSLRASAKVMACLLCAPSPRPSLLVLVADK